MLFVSTLTLLRSGDGHVSLVGYDYQKFSNCGSVDMFKFKFPYQLVTSLSCMYSPAIVDAALVYRARLKLLKRGLLLKSA
jgi:hypothetical protein